jgi:hypothetical protein
MTASAPTEGRPTVGYDVFVSYRTRSSGRQARQLSRALFNLAKRHLDDRNLNVFLDANRLVAGSLDTNIKRALRASRALVVVLDASTKESTWVAEEIEYWLANGGSNDRLFLVRTDPELDLSWNKDANDFANPEQLPAPLRALFGTEQKYFDILRSRSIDESSLVGLYSAVMEVEPEALLLEESQYQRRRRRRSTAIIAVLAIMLVLAAGAGVIALQQSRRSQQAARTAQAEAAASGALLTLPYSYPEAIDQALAASALGNSQSVRSALIAVANGSGALRRTIDWSQVGTGLPATGIAFSTDGNRLLAWGRAKDANRSHLTAWSVVSGEKVVDTDVAAADLSDVREVGAVGYVACADGRPVLLDRRTYAVSQLLGPAAGGEQTGGCATLAFAGGVLARIGGEGTETSPAVAFVSYAGRRAVFPGATLGRFNVDSWSAPLITSTGLTLVSARGQARVHLPTDFEVRLVTSEGAVLVRAAGSWYRIQHGTSGASATKTALDVPNGAAAVTLYSDYQTKANYAWITAFGEVGSSTSPETVRLADDQPGPIRQHTFASEILPSGDVGLFASVGGTAYRLEPPQSGEGWVTRRLNLDLGAATADGVSPVATYCDSGEAIGLTSAQWMLDSVETTASVTGSVAPDARLDNCTLVDPGPPLTVDGVRITDGAVDSEVVVSGGTPGGVALLRPGMVIQLFATGGRVENVWRNSVNRLAVTALGERTVVQAGEQIASLSGKGAQDVLAELVDPVQVASPDGMEAIAGREDDVRESPLTFAGRGRSDAVHQDCVSALKLPEYIPGPNFVNSVADAEKQLPVAFWDDEWIDCRSGAGVTRDDVKIEQYEIGEQNGRIVWSREQRGRTAHHATTWTRGQDGPPRTIDLPAIAGSSGETERASFDSTGNRLLVSDTESPVIRSFTWSDGKWSPGATLQAAIGNVQATAWSRDTSLVIAAGKNGGFELYDFATGRRLITQVGSAGEAAVSLPERVKVTESDGFLRAQIEGLSNFSLEIPISIDRLRELLCVVHHATACPSAGR